MELNEIAQKLYNARITAKPIASPHLNLMAAQKILKEGIDLRLLRGEELTGITLHGKKYFSYLTNQMNLIPGGLFSVKDCILPKISAHFVYYIDSYLDAKTGSEKILNAISSTGLALKVSDSRYEKGYQVTLEEKIADNFFTSYYILGQTRLSLNEIKDRPIRVALKFNNEKKIELEITSLSYGLPLLGEISQKLEPGTIVLTPNFFDEIELSPNMDISLVADYFGSVNFRVI